MIIVAANGVNQVEHSDEGVGNGQRRVAEWSGKEERSSGTRDDVEDG
jgi:hypothetical protein